MVRVTATVPVVQRNGVLATKGFLVPLSVQSAPPDHATAFIIIENGENPITLEVSLADLREALTRVEVRR